MDKLLKNLIYLRTNLDITKLHKYDPEFHKLIPLVESDLHSLQTIKENDLADNIFPDGHFKLIELLQFISINILDFLIAFQNYFNGLTKWEKNYACRQLALILYEFTDDIHRTINETLQKNEEIDKINSNLKPQINKVVKKIRFIKQLKYDEHLKVLRHQTIAHKEEDIQRLYDRIQTLDETLVIACSMFFVNWIYEFFDLVKEIPKKLEAIQKTRIRQ
ncbi:MAG: hypothetical protein ABIP68_00270 [Ferruginibacter sp.]